MGRARLLPFCLLFVCGPALGAGARIHVDYDHATSFGEYTSFQLLDTRHDLRRVSSELHLAVARRVIAYARDGGLALVPADPDVYFAYYAAHQGELRLAPEDLVYGYGEAFSPGSYWEGRGAGDAGNGSFSFAQGTVVLDVWDRERRVLVWRGIAVGAFRKDLEADRVRLGKALTKLMTRWEEMYGTGPRSALGIEDDRRR